MRVSISQRAYAQLVSASCIAHLDVTGRARTMAS